MQKTKLGISVGLLGAAIYFSGLFSGMLVAVLLTGYVLLFEENEWLKKSAVKAIALMIFISLIVTVINLVPDTVGVIGNVVAVFGGNFAINALTYVVSALVNIIDIIEKLLFIILGLKAFNQGTISIPIVDNLISKYMG